MQITTSWHEKGKIEGEIKGKIEGKIEDICKFMVRRFGADQGEVMSKIQQVASLEGLNSILEKLFAAGTAEEAWSIISNLSERSLQ